MTATEQPEWFREMYREAARDAAKGVTVPDSVIDRAFAFVRATEVCCDN